MTLPKGPCLPPHLPLFLFSLSLLIPISSASDSISVNSSLSGSQTLTSQGGKFVLGFFQPGNSSHKYYIGIWYATISQVTPVWVANRASPVSDPATSELKISEDGNLVLFDQSTNAQIWSTNAKTTSKNTVAILQDSGNLVLRDGSNSTKVIWQSIDHPTNTWLPGGKLSLNMVTRVPQHLTSWKNSDDPAPGIFSLELDPDGSSQYIIQWNLSVNYWSSGPWNGEIFSLVPEMTQGYIYNFSYVNNSQENYFTYSIKSSSSSIISRFIMDVSGQIKQLTWVESAQSWILFWSQPRAQCQVYALCGPFGSCNDNRQLYCNCVRGFREKSPNEWDSSDYSGGCVRNTQLQCGSNSSAAGVKDKFLPIPNMGLPDNSHVILEAGGDGECEAACLNNCSCTAYSTDSGCYVWYGDLLNLQELLSGSGNTLYLRLAASELLPGSKSNKRLVAGVVAGVVAGLVALFAVVWVMLCRRRRRRMASSSKAVEGGLVSFRYSDLLRATKNFSERLGGGGFGSVFKGTLPDSTAIAVKKLEGLSQGEKQFRTEVSTIGSVQHVNLVRLRGFCSEGHQKLLVYDFMPKGSLDTQLFGSSMVLDWNMRYQIALGIAKGLLYLHEKCRDCIIHCDIKPENILLDASLVPKVADFGLAKLVGRDFSRVLTTMRGTRGYLAPEWISGVAITAKADVYSYGMMLFEIISGRRNSEQLDEGQTGFFPKLAATKLMEGDVIGVLDHRLRGDANLEELTRACKVSCWCIQDDENFRPSIGQVLQILEGVLEVGMPPVPKSLQIFADNSENIVFFSNFSSNPSSQTQNTTSTSSQSKDTSSMSSKG